MRCLGSSLLLFLATFATFTEGYRILCLFPFNGKSHQVMYEALCKGLAQKGHQVDMISHFPTKRPLANYTDIVDLSGTRKSVVNSFSIDYTKSLQISLVYKFATTFGGDLCDLMGLERMQKFIKNPPRDPPYDLVITEFFGASCYLGFGKFLNAPLVLASSCVEFPYLSELMGNPWNSAFYSGYFTNSIGLETFWDRFWNFVYNFVKTKEFFYYTAYQDELMRKHLGRDMPSLREIERSAALLLVNSYTSLNGIRPITQAVVEVGGLHIEGPDRSKLSSELEAWLNTAEDGVVYFSLGSLVNIETLPERTMLDLYASFAKISPIKVLMKIADKTKLPPGLPSNIITSSWIPQVPVLRHKNVVLFITHGGLMGTQESLYYGVPMIGIPLFADQMKNVDIYVQKNMAVRLELENITEASMDATLNAVLHDPKYRQFAKRESHLFRDRPMSAMDTAIFWVEYVIRNGPNALRSPAVDMPFWKLHLFDVFAFLLVSAIIVIYTLTIICKFLWRKSRGTSSNVTNRKKFN